MRAALRLILIVVAAAGALAPAAGASQAPSGSLGIRLVDVPTEARKDPRANQYIVDSVKPGTVIRRRIEVSNDSTQPQTPRLYTGGARIADGAFVPADTSDAGGANEVVAWSSVDPGSMTLAPGTKGVATVSIAVPASAAAGERYGAIWAELPPVDTGGGIASVNRVGIRIYLDVSESGAPPTAFRLDSFAPSLSTDGRPVVDIHACNDGQRAIDLTGELSLTDGPGGVAAGPFSSAGPALTLAPGQCGDVAIALRPDLPKGPWKATATLRSGPFSESATASITFPDDPGTTAPAVKAKPRDVTGTTGGRLALLLALLLLLLVLLLLWWLWRRRRKDEEEEDPAALLQDEEPVSTSH